MTTGMPHRNLLLMLFYTAIVGYVYYLIDYMCYFIVTCTMQVSVLLP